MKFRAILPDKSMKLCFSYGPVPTPTSSCIQWHGQHKSLSPCLMAQLDPMALWMGNNFMDHSSDRGVQLNGRHTNKTVHKPIKENDISCKGMGKGKR